MTFTVGNPGVDTKPTFVGTTDTVMIYEGSGFPATTALSGLHTSYPRTSFGLFAYGVGTSMWDVAMNVEGAEVERRLGRTIMPRFHAAWSVGSIVGSGIGILMAALAVPVLVYDLNVGGCFVNSSRQPEIGSTLALQISLPEDGSINVSAEALYQHQHGFAVRVLPINSLTRRPKTRRNSRLPARWKKPPCRTAWVSRA